MAFYLKYRPQTVDELDLEIVREQIGKILSSSHFPHAFLFSGPKGLGKTSAARILVKAINCEQKPDTKKKKTHTGSWEEPCNKCEACKSITDGTALDLIEIDGASNRGIDDIRSLRETIKLTPFRLKYKVYVIDEAHMLTKEAFNALLKTLEEPSAHAIFVLATTEPEKIPETIISRCIHVKFKKASEKEMIRSLKRITKGEKLKVDDGALEIIVQNTDGSFRDAVKLLEQLSFDTKNITFKQAQNLINQSGEFDLSKCLLLILDKNTKESLLMLQEAIDEGVSLRWLVVKSLEKLRDYLFYKQGVISDFGEKEEKWRQQVDKINIEAESLISLMRLLDKAGVELKNAVVSGLPLQLTIMEYGNNIKHRVSNIKDKDEKLTISSNSAARQISKPETQNTNKNRIEKLKKEEDAETLPRPAPPAGRSQQVKASEEKKEEKKPEIEEEKIDPKRVKKITTNLKNVKDNWDKFLQLLRPHNSSIEALLRSSRPFKMDDGVLVLEVFYKFHKERLENGKCPKVMEKVLKELFGEQFKVKCVLGERSKKPRPVTGRSLDEKAGKGNNVINESATSDIIKNAEEIFMK